MNTQESACSLPDAFLEQMKSLLGEAGFFKYLNAMEMPAKKGLRVNPLKWPDQLSEQKDLLHLLSLERDGSARVDTSACLRPVLWAEHGYYYEDPLRPGQSPLHEAGLYYIQEPSAMSAVMLLDPSPGETVLDLCAAPGGKSTQIAARMGGRGLLVSNEPVANRAKILSSNIERMGIRNCIVTSALPEQLSGRFPVFFDRILVDAPCSGEGMFRKAPESRTEWHAGSPVQCAARQKQILSDAARMLKPGGTLVYSTCTFNPVENEGVIEDFLRSHPDYQLMSFELCGLPSAEHGMLHIYPHISEGEGHFLARLMRTSEKEISFPEFDKWGKGGPRNSRKKSGREPVPVLPEVLIPLKPDEERMYTDGRTLWLLPQGIDPESFRNIKVLRAGLALCDLSGRQAEPAHAAGMALCEDEVSNVCELTFDEMTDYQAGETIHKACPKGWVLLQYEGISLGWGKQADGMIKNHYPKGLRRRGGIYT